MKKNNVINNIHTVDLEFGNVLSVQRLDKIITVKELYVEEDNDGKQIAREISSMYFTRKELAVIIKLLKRVV